MPTASGERCRRGVADAGVGDASVGVADASRRVNPWGTLLSSVSSSTLIRRPPGMWGTCQTATPVSHWLLTETGACCAAADCVLDAVEQGDAGGDSAMRAATLCTSHTSSGSSSSTQPSISGDFLSDVCALSKKSSVACIPLTYPEAGMAPSSSSGNSASSRSPGTTGMSTSGVASSGMAGATSSSTDP